jgi:glutaredoxin
MFPEFIEKLTKSVVGENDNHDIIVFSLSTCSWCKKGKNFLNERSIKYRYVDLDKIDPSEKSKVLTYLRENYKPDRISYPFVVCDDEFVVGYNPGKYEELISQGGN